MADDGTARRSGMREVAHAAGVSVSTVANVLSRPSIVAPQTRRRVEEAIHSVGYVPSGPARQLRGLPSAIVGSVTLDLANPFFAELNRGIEDRLAEAGCLVLACSTDLQAGKERQILELLQQQGVRGIIISPIDPDPTTLFRLSRRGIPVVLIDHPRGRLDMCAVAVDDVLGGQLAAEHLVSLGHRRIAFLSASVNPDPVTRRREGLRQALATAGLDPDETLLDVQVAVHPPPLVDAAAAAAEQILSAEPRPTAVVCLNDTAALGLLDGLHAAGVRVPEDISVVGYDDLPFTRRLAPALTTVHQPKYQLGRAAADLLLDEARPDHAHREIRFQPTLVIRSSSAAPSRPRNRPRPRTAVTSASTGTPRR
jgi:LacI family transcriptional regulator